MNVFWGEKMGIIRTDRWLKEDFDNPLTICEKLMPYFRRQSAREIYRELVSFGMYQPSRTTRNNHMRMLEQQSWGKVEEIFSKYKSKWNGPDIPIFLFPIAQTGGFFSREEKGKGGVSFPDKLFLFISNFDYPKEIEALFVHEYHHVCRMRQLEKKIEDYTLLDSIIIEGLAEYTVFKNCGKDLLATWCNMYSKEELSKFWNRYIKDELGIKKNDRGHDELLYGSRRIPKLLGYAIGFDIVKNYYKKHPFSMKETFITPSAIYIEDLKANYI